jgi:hypothetical protein
MMSRLPSIVNLEPTAQNSRKLVEWSKATVLSEVKSAGCLQEFFRGV